MAPTTSDTREALLPPWNRGASPDEEEDPEHVIQLGDGRPGAVGRAHHRPAVFGVVVAMASIAALLVLARSLGGAVTDTTVGAAREETRWVQDRHAGFNACNGQQRVWLEGASTHPPLPPTPECQPCNAARVRCAVP